MCVIIHKPRGIQVNEQVLALAHKSNTHGAGFVLSTPDKGVYFAKGFLNDEKMVEFLDQMCGELGVLAEDTEIVFHFRISTAGNINPMNCHPFVIDEKLIYKTQGKVENAWVLAHNGHHAVFPDMFGIDRDDLKMYSDTFLMVRDGLAQCKPRLRVNVLEHYANKGQKYAVMFPNGEVRRYGSFTYDEDTKCYYSNMLWKPYRPKALTSQAGVQTPLPWTDGVYYTDAPSRDGDYVYDQEYGLWYKVPEFDKEDGYDFDTPDPYCTHERTYLDGGNGYVYCEDCGGNMTLNCEHWDIDDKGYCNTCNELVGLPSSDQDECDHPRTLSIDEKSKEGHDIRTTECLDCGYIISVKYLHPEQVTKE